MGWDTSKVTNMTFTFYNADNFNQQLTWDTSQVTTMEGTFGSANAFNSEDELGYEQSGGHEVHVQGRTPSTPSSHRIRAR